MTLNRASRSLDLWVRVEPDEIRLLNVDSTKMSHVCDTISFLCYESNNCQFYIKTKLIACMISRET